MIVPALTELPALALQLEPAPDPVVQLMIDEDVVHVFVVVEGDTLNNTQVVLAPGFGKELLLHRA